MISRGAKRRSMIPKSGDRFSDKIMLHEQTPTPGAVSD
jgi:hypothetical protein